MRAHFFSHDHRHASGHGYGTAHHAGGGHALCMLAAGALLWNSWRYVSRVHRLRLQGQSDCLPQPLETWEGEGGRPDPVEPNRAGANQAVPGSGPAPA
jgi:hypothetical protein